MSQPPDICPSHYLGELSGLLGDLLYGWAMDPQQPGQRLAVEIYIDGIFVALTRADQEQPADSTGDGFHGFAIQLHKTWLDQARQITVRVANQGPWLGQPLVLPARTPQPPAPPASRAWHAGGLKIRGWGWDPEQPGRHMEIRVRDGEQLLLTVRADRPHPALVYQSQADHGFEIDLPWSLADGQRHEIYLDTDRNTPVTGSPFPLCLHPEGLSSLLHRYWQETGQDSPAFRLLEPLVLEQERRNPASAGFSHYPDWLALFQQPAPLTVHSGQVLVVLTGPGDTQQEAASRASLEAQRLPRSQFQVISPASGQLAAALTERLSGCTLVIPLQRGDQLLPHALDRLLEVFAGHPEAAWGYSDCDQAGPDGQPSNPWFKPAWDETLFYGVDLISPGAIFRSPSLRQAMQKLQDSDLAGQISWPLLLASLIALDSGPVLHLPEMLYRRRACAPRQPWQGLPTQARQQTLYWLLAQRAPQATLEPLRQWPALNRVHWPLPEVLPTISLIIPTRDQLPLLRRCMEGLLEQTDYPALELIVVDNDSCAPETHTYLAQLQARGVRVLPWPHPFNYATIQNLAVEQARGDIIGLINNDIEVREPGWLKEMLAQLVRPGIGAVGAKLLWPNDMVQHGGVVVGINGLAAHTGNEWLAQDPGYLGFNQLAREQSAITAACLLLCKKDWQALGGMDERHYPVTFNDVDLCLRLRASGKRLVWTPFACLTHAESASRGKEDTPSKTARARREYAHFIRQWTGQGQTDPCYHPALASDWLNGPYGGLALPPRPQTPRYPAPFKAEI